MDIAMAIVRVAGLLDAAGAALGLIFWSGIVAKGAALIALVVFCAVLVAPARWGPKVGGLLLTLTTVVAFMAPAGGITFDPTRAALFLLVASFALALAGPMFAESFGRLLRR